MRGRRGEVVWGDLVKATERRRYPSAGMRWVAGRIMYVYVGLARRSGVGGIRGVWDYLGRRLSVDIVLWQKETILLFAVRLRVYLRHFLLVSPGMPLRLAIFVLENLHVSFFGENLFV